MNDRALFRTSGLAIMIGAVAGAVFNLMHPRDFDFDNLAESVLSSVGKTSAWSPIHIGLVFAVVLGLLGLTGLYRSIGGHFGAALARLGLVAAIVGAALLLVALAIDGVGMQSAADSLAGSSSERTFAVATAKTLTAASAGFLSVGIMIYFGLGFGLFSMAIAYGEGYPKWLGWLGVLGALVALWGGSLYFYDARMTESTLNIIVAASLYLTVIGFVLGLLLWRKGSAVQEGEK